MSQQQNKNHSIKRKLVNNISAVISVILFTIFLTVDLSVDTWVEDQFNQSLTNKANYLKTLVEDDNNVAKRMSLVFIGWNIIWNFSLFNIYFSYSVVNFKYSHFIAPAFFYFMISFLFELKMLLLCWKANNSRVIQLGVDEARKALITFYVKYY